VLLAAMCAAVGKSRERNTATVRRGGDGPHICVCFCTSRSRSWRAISDGFHLRSGPPSGTASPSQSQFASSGASLFCGGSSLSAIPARVRRARAERGSKDDGRANTALLTVGPGPCGAGVEAKPCMTVLRRTCLAGSCRKSLQYRGYRACITGAVPLLAHADVVALPSGSPSPRRDERALNSPWRRRIDRSELGCDALH
jgi:hypothetical protein